jgi:Domain of unknown function (DUF4384)
MPLRNYLLCFVSILALGLYGTAQDPSDEDEDVRGSFLVTRPASKKPANRPGATNKPGTSRKSGTASTKPKVRNPQPNPGKNGPQPVDNKPSKDPGSGEAGATSKEPIGLGYSLYMKNSDGSAVRVDPTRVFHANDSIRISLEPNTDGYLYVFYTENDGHPVMLFPDARLAQGENRIEAHVPYEVPSSLETDPAHRWFVFDNKPAIERLYVVVTREPIATVPSGSKLLEYCRAIEKSGCLWKPDQATWSNVTAGLTRKASVSKSRNFGQPQSEDEAEASLRGLGLAEDAPEPSVVRMNATADAPMLVTVIQLTHQ